MSREIKHIAVIRLSAMGDVAMTVPVLLALASQYPDVKITMISRALYKPFFDAIPNTEFLAFDPKGQHKGLAGILRFTATLRKRNPDAFADLHNVLRSKVITTILKLSGVRVAVFDKARAAKKALTRADDKIFEPLPSVFERHAEVFRKLGFELDRIAVFLPKLPADDQISLLFENSLPVIGIAPFAQHESKVYPADLMQQVIANLADDHRIMLFGSKAELEALQQLASDLPHVEIVAGKYTFSQELQIISRLNLMLSMDSGNAHIAAMYGVPVVTLWGATHPFAGFAPYSQPEGNALVSDRKKFPKLPTSIYGNKVVDGYQDAMRTISPEMVVAKVRELL